MDKNSRSSEIEGPERVEHDIVELVQKRGAVSVVWKFFWL